MLSEYPVKQGETIYDVANRTYGSTDYVYKLIQDNGISNIDFDFSLNPGKVLTWDPSFKVLQAVDVASAPSVPVSPIKTIKALYGQSIYDLCLQAYGTLDFIFKFIQENQISNINDTNLSGNTFIFDSTITEENTNADYATLIN